MVLIRLLKVNKLFFSLVFAFISCVGSTQELFVFTEPASNMPKGSVGFRITSNINQLQTDTRYNVNILPELMLGANKKLMVHADAFVNNTNKNYNVKGFGAYAKYRFYSKDNIHRHFRMAVYGRLSYNASNIQQEEIETAGYNSGYETGLIATQLLHKVAVSSSFSFEKALDNNTYKFPDNQSSNAVNYTLSIGKLMLPKEYTNYRQTNLNIMMEFLGQTLVGNKNTGSYLDGAATVQFIINSQARFDVGYRQQLYSTVYRFAPNGFLLRFEYLLFNLL